MKTILRNWRINDRQFRFLILLLLPVLLTSCSGQNPRNSIIEQDTSFKQTVSKDPLFFIEGQLCQHVRNIFQDQKGNLWFGTNVYGLMMYDGDSLRYFDEKDGLGAGRITGIVEDDSGNLWFGTSSGLTKFDGASFLNFTTKDGLLNDEIWSLAIDRKSQIWIGTNEGLSIFDGSTFRHLDIPKPAIENPNTIYSLDRIVSIVEDPNGHIWLGTDGFGICKFDGKSFTHYTKKEGLSDNTIHGMMIDRNGQLWIGTFFGGLSRFDGKTFTNFTSEGVVEGAEVGGFFEDKNGAIWFAVENYGVYRFQNGTFTNYYKQAGLPTNGILSIYKDRENRFWFGGWGGLFRYKEKTFNSITKDGPWSS